MFVGAIRVRDLLFEGPNLSYRPCKGNVAGGVAQGADHFHLSGPTIKGAPSGRYGLFVLQ